MTKKKYLGPAMLLFFALATFASARSQPPPPAGEDILVGHISHVEGQLLRYVSEESDWVATVKDAPFGLDDALYSDENTKAEFIIPNETWIRTGGSTQIQLIALKRDVTEADMASGTARFYNRSSHGVIRVTTEFGSVVAGRDTIFDLYVGDESVEVIALKGFVDFIHEKNQARYKVVAGLSVIADGGKVSSADANVDAQWDDWNVDRDRLWRKWQAGSGNSGRYLPPSLRDEAYVLEENGRWEEVRYEGGTRRFWRPTSVGSGWSPFTAGRWTDYHGDNTWIPDEQFGYVTHHYGNWIYTDNIWYWAPPVVSVEVGIGPFLAGGLGWYPGRVGWIHTGVEIGWVPLAWNEPYYAYRRWGSRTTVIDSGSQININIGSYRYLDSAIVVNRDRLYSSRNYRDARIGNISRETITRDYRAAPVVSDRVIDNYRTIKERHNFTDAKVERKPHELVRDRIERNEKLSRQVRQVEKVSAAVVQQHVRKSRTGKIDREARIAQPKVSNKLVRTDEVAKPRAAGDFQKKALKTTTRKIAPAEVAKGKSAKGRPEKQQPAVRQEKSDKKEKPAGPGKKEQSGGGPGEKSLGKQPHKEKEGHK
jgi:hypothetical protein